MLRCQDLCNFLCKDNLLWKMSTKTILFFNEAAVKWSYYPYERHMEGNQKLKKLILCIILWLKPHFAELCFHSRKNHDDGHHCAEKKEERENQSCDGGVIWGGTAATQKTGCWTTETGGLRGIISGKRGEKKSKNVKLCARQSTLITYNLMLKHMKFKSLTECATMENSAVKSLNMMVIFHKC